MRLVFRWIVKCARPSFFRRGQGTDALTAGSIEIIFAGGRRISIVLAILDTGDTGGDWARQISVDIMRLNVLNYNINRPDRPLDGDADVSNAGGTTGGIWRGARRHRNKRTQAI
jgi:hypothetical protein